MSFSNNFLNHIRINYPTQVALIGSISYLLYNMYGSDIKRKLMNEWCPMLAINSKKILSEKLTIF